MNSIEKTIAATVAATSISAASITGLPAEKAEAQMYQQQNQNTQVRRPTTKRQQECQIENYNYNAQCYRTIHEYRQQIIREQNIRTQENMRRHNEGADYIRQYREQQRRQRHPHYIQPNYRDNNNNTFIRTRDANGNEIILKIN